MSFVFSPSIVTDGLIFYLDAANTRSYSGSGTVINDLTKNMRTGTLVNGVSYNSLNSGSLVFDGVDDYVSLGNSLNITTQIRTFDFWIKTSYIGDTQSILGNRDMNNSGWVIQIDNSVTMFYNALSATRISTSTGITNNQWRNVTIVRGGIANNKIYIDGISQTLNINNENLTNPSDTLETNIGRQVTGVGPVYGGYFNGNIANVKIYNKILTEQEVKQNYNALKNRFGL